MGTLHTLEICYKGLETLDTLDICYKVFGTLYTLYIWYRGLDTLDTLDICYRGLKTLDTLNICYRGLDMLDTLDICYRGVSVDNDQRVLCLSRQSFYVMNILGKLCSLKLNNIEIELFLSDQCHRNIALNMKILFSKTLYMTP